MTVSRQYKEQWNVFSYPVLMWYNQKWMCKNLKMAQMQLELEINEIFLN